MFMTPVTADVVRPRYVVSALPKSGLHLFVGMIQAICEPMPGHFLHHNGPWWGTFDGHSFTSQWGDIERQLRLASFLQPGKFFRGHVGYLPEVERFLFHMGVAHVFIYRDLRDVAVSQTFHVRSTEDDRFIHPAKQFYQSMSFDDALSAVIAGAGPYTGVMERWEFYAPWLDVEWVHKVRFEDALADREAVARDILDYGLRRTLGGFDADLKVDRDNYTEAIKAMVEASQNTGASVTFRTGKVGGWREHFTEEHKRLFKESDASGWLVTLGYEQDDNW